MMKNNIRAKPIQNVFLFSPHIRRSSSFGRSKVPAVPGVGAYVELDWWFLCQSDELGLNASVPYAAAQYEGLVNVGLVYCALSDP